MTAVQTAPIRDENEQGVLAWHFCRKDMRLANGDGRQIIVGETLTVDCQPEVYVIGLHGSVRAIDALSYAAGPVIERVLIDGSISRDAANLCGTSRKCIAVADATVALHEFACWCAERALTRESQDGRKPDQRSVEAVAAKRRWLRGEGTDAELATAEFAAADAAELAAKATVNAVGRAKLAAEAAMNTADAAEAAAEAVADAEAEESATDAAWAAAMAAAWSAADAGGGAVSDAEAVWAAAMAAAWSAADAGGGAVSDAEAVWAAARGAERELQNLDLERRLYELLGIRKGGVK